MSERIKQRIKEHSHHISARVGNPEPYEDRLLEFILSELAEAERRGEARLLNEWRQEIAELHKERSKLMVTAADLKVTSDALTAAVDGLAAIVTNPQASTPDATVKGFQSDVAAQTARIVALEAPTPPPTP